MKDVLLSSLEPGTIFTGNKGNNFIVLKQNGAETMVISEGLMQKRVGFGNNTNYLESDLKKLIENEIQPIIESEFGTENLVEHDTEIITIDMQKPYGILKSKVRPITFDEAREFNDLLVGKGCGLDDWYWTLTPWSTKERGWEYSVCVVCPSGVIGNCHYDYNVGVRPFCILKSNIFVSAKNV